VLIDPRCVSGMRRIEWIEGSARAMTKTRVSQNAGNPKLPAAPGVPNGGARDRYNPVIDCADRERRSAGDLGQWAAAIMGRALGGTTGTT
jgi:hypothetical protein